MKRIIYLPIFLLHFSISCVGPAEPDHGLVKNMVVLVNTVDAFTFTLRGEAYSFEENYDLKLSLGDGQTFSTTLVVTNFKGKDTTYVKVSADNGALIHNFVLIGNAVMVEPGQTTAPKKINIKGTNFSGIMELVMARE